MSEVKQWSGSITIGVRGCDESTVDAEMKKLRKIAEASPDVEVLVEDIWEDGDE